MNITINVPEWGVYALLAMMAISAIVNIWHALAVRKFEKAQRKSWYQPL